MLSTLVSLVFALQTFVTPAAAAESNRQIEMNFGFGYHLCAIRDTPPPMETAYMCPGRYPTFEKKTIKMTEEKTSNPNWRLWSGPLKYKEEVMGVTFEVELLVSYADLGAGSTMAYIDGRIGNSTTKQKTYFRVSTPGNFENFNHVTQYGFPVTVKPKDTAFELSPHVIVTGKNARLH